MRVAAPGEAAAAFASAWQDPSLGAGVPAAALLQALQVHREHRIELAGPLCAKQGAPSGRKMSEDSTLAERPGSAPTWSNRTSVDEVAAAAAGIAGTASEPSRSQRASLDGGPSSSGQPVGSPATKAAMLLEQQLSKALSSATLRSAPPGGSGSGAPAGGPQQPLQRCPSPFEQENEPIAGRSSSAPYLSHQTTAAAGATSGLPLSTGMTSPSTLEAVPALPPAPQPLRQQPTHSSHALDALLVQQLLEAAQQLPRARNQASLERNPSTGTPLRFRAQRGAPAVGLTSAAALQQASLSSGSSSLAGGDPSVPQPLPPSVHGVYGAHIMKPPQHGALGSPDRDLPSPGLELQSRSSIELLLDPVPGAHSRHSLDSLQELLISPLAGLPRVAGATTVAQLLQQFTDHPICSRHSMDDSRKLPVNSQRQMQPPGSSCLGKNLGVYATPPRGATLEPFSSGVLSALSSVSMHDLANSTVTVVAGATPRDIPTGGKAAGSTVAACASTVVDPSPPSAVGHYMPTIGGAPAVDAWLDPEIHDTFGGHAWCSVNPRPQGASPLFGTSAPPAASQQRQGQGGSGGGKEGDAIMQAIAMMGGRGGRGPSAGRNSADAGGNGWPAGAPQQQLQQQQPGTAPGLLAAPRGGSEGAARPPMPTGATDSGGQQPPAAAGGAAAVSNANVEGVTHASMLGPSSVHGQHSVTVQDPQGIVPSYDFLRQRQLAKKRLEEYTVNAGGGYIAEAKRVLAAALTEATPSEAEMVETSYSGAIGPLLKYLRDHKHDDAALGSALHTLSLLVSNSPNRGIIVELKGHQVLCEIMRATSELEIREQLLQLLWDLSLPQQECIFQGADLRPLLQVLEATSSATTASHVLNFLHSCCGLKGRIAELPEEEIIETARHLVQEIAAHKHHLQDAAQYTLGTLLATVLGQSVLPGAEREALAARLLAELQRASTIGQCQVVLTVLSSLAGNACVRSALAHCDARRRLMEFGQHVGDPRLRARSLSLVKVLAKQEQLELGGWYAGAH